MTQLTAINRKNLEKLATYLEGLPVDYEKFNMRHMLADDDGEEFDLRDPGRARVIHKCGSSACAIGHGPNAGIRISPHDWSWTQYADRVFGVNHFTNGIGEYMFGGNMGGDHRDAAKRIREVLADAQN